jgi:TPR repeat protein
VNKLIVGVIAVAALSGAGLYGLLSPGVLEWRLERDCPQVTEACTARVRALAHMLSAKGQTDRAIKWYRKGADAGDPLSMFHLAWMIEQRAIEKLPTRPSAAFGMVGVMPGALRSEFDLATTWYRRSAEKGFAPAMNNLGQVHAHGFIGARNPEMAVHYYRMAAQAGNPVAAFNLTLAYLLGDGVIQSGREAEKWIEWSPSRKFSQADLQQPTLERSRLHGGMLSSNLRDKLRAAASSGPPATAKLEFQPLKPASNLPTFEQVRR